MLERPVYTAMFDRDCASDLPEVRGAPSESRISLRAFRGSFPAARFSGKGLSQTADTWLDRSRGSVKRAAIAGIGRED